MRYGTQNIFLGIFFRHPRPNLELETPYPALVLQDFHSQKSQLRIGCKIAFHPQFRRKAASDKAFTKTAVPLCTIFGQGLVDGVHSIEKTCT